jgi:BirA family transcriptional regulator, biotin operon repressor / biotin---[acetyl-CoA-carboxylase] ligase
LYKIQPNTLIFGKITEFLPTCHSTNDIAAEMIQNSDVLEGTLVITTDQTAGRGQRGNQWEAQPGQNITLSLILKPQFLEATEQFYLNMAVSLGVWATLEPLLGSDLKLKWPNDIYVGNQKMGGILIENTLLGRRLGFSVVGIGLNINQIHFSYPTATSLTLQTGQIYEHRRLVERLLENLEKYYWQLLQGQRQALRQAYHEVLFRWQEAHYFEAQGQRFLAKIEGVNERGQLCLRTEQDLQMFDFKEVQFVL